MNSQFIWLHKSIALCATNSLGQKLRTGDIYIYTYIFFYIQLSRTNKGKAGPSMLLTIQKARMVK